MHTLYQSKKYMFHGTHDIHYIHANWKPCLQKKSEQTEAKKPVKLTYDEDGDLIRDDLEEELEIQIKHKIQSDLGSIFLYNWLNHSTQIWVLSQAEKIIIVA